MLDYRDARVQEERMKDLQRYAANERLAAEVRNENGLVNAARRALGHGLVVVGQQLLDDHQR